MYPPKKVVEEARGNCASEKISVFSAGWEGLSHGCREQGAGSQRILQFGADCVWLVEAPKASIATTSRHFSSISTPIGPDPPHSGCESSLSIISTACLGSPNQIMAEAPKKRWGAGSSRAAAMQAAASVVGNRQEERKENGDVSGEGGEAGGGGGGGAIPTRQAPGGATSTFSWANNFANARHGGQDAARRKCLCDPPHQPPNLCIVSWIRCTLHSTSTECMHGTVES